MVVVVCLAVVVADLWIGIGPHQQKFSIRFVVPPLRGEDVLPFYL